jgi:hypothetical protein
LAEVRIIGFKDERCLLIIFTAKVEVAPSERCATTV